LISAPPPPHSHDHHSHDPLKLFYSQYLLDPCLSTSD
jgi:hypothetical protein